MKAKRRWQPTIIGVTVVALAAIGLVVARRSDGQEVPTLTPAQAELLKAQAFAFSAASGEPAPRDAQVVGGKRKAVVAGITGGAEVLDSDQGVFAIRLQGNFTVYQASRPHGSPPPRGRFLVLVYDAGTNELTDWSLRDEPPDLSKIGKPEPLP
jgi:hypothetical protein